MTYFFMLDKDSPVTESTFEREFDDDNTAVNVLLEQFGNDLLLVYKENNAADGLPFDIVFDRP